MIPRDEKRLLGHGFLGNMLELKVNSNFRHNKLINNETILLICVYSKTTVKIQLLQQFKVFFMN